MMRSLAVFRLFAALVLSFSLALLAVGPVGAAQPTDSGKAVPAAGGQATPAQWATLKASLNATPGLTRTVSVSGDTRTLTYTSKSGESLVLREPVHALGGAVKPNVALTGCGWFQECVLLTNNDLTVISAGGGAFIIVALCVLGVPVCAVASAVVTSAAAWIAVNGICRHYFEMEIFPWFGAPWNYGCW